LRPETDFKRLEEELRGGSIRPFYLLYGDESYLIERALKEILATLQSPQLWELNFTSYYAEETPPHEVITTCNTLPFMGKRRVVVVKDVHKYSQKDLTGFSSYLQSPSDTTSLVLIAEELPTEFLKEVKESAFHLRRPPQRELPLWIRTIAGEMDKEISNEAVEYLQEATGRDLQGIHNELFKISLYVGDKKRIELHDVEGIVSELKVASIFELTKALGEQDVKRALRTFGKIWESGEHYLKILGMITRQFRYLIITKEVIEKGGSEHDIRRGLQLSNPYFVKELSTQAKSFSSEALQSILVSLLETDMSLKRSSLPRRLLLEELIIKLCKVQ
jgi:DNA polymerase-3 subunit delta